MKNKGITLIALVITIIVMLILVLVTINVATDGGLIGKAQNAKDQTQRSADYEELEIAIAAAKNYDTGELTMQALEKELRDGWTVTSDENGFICTSPNGNIFTVSFNGNIEDLSEEELSAEVPDALKQYIFGENLQGRNFELDLYPGEFVDSTGMLEKGLKELPEYLAGNYAYGDGYIHYFKYDGSYFKINTDYQNLTNVEYGIKKLPDIQISTSTINIGLGSKIHYDNQDWIVMYNDTNEFQMVSVNVNSYNPSKFFDIFALGKEDYYLINHDLVEGKNDFEKAVFSYNNAIKTLNEACKEIIDTDPTYIKDVRCIGSNKTNKNAENAQLFTSDFLANNPVDYKGIGNGILKSTDKNYIGDFERLVQLKINIAPSILGKGSNASSYFLASRLVDDNTGTTSHSYNFAIRYILFDGCIEGASSLLDFSPENFNGRASFYGLRPVVIIDKTKCNFTWNSGNGYFEISEK